MNNRTLKPQTAEEVVSAQTIQGMKDRIMGCGRLVDPLINNALCYQQITEISDGDMFIFLAYHALLSRERLIEEQIKCHQNCTKPLIIPMKEPN